ncbi:MAG: hypothetical protein H6704_28820 [Myxococcales bacterium]|nr:hypothetical protein [Myxococcales bacterium]
MNARWVGALSLTALLGGPAAAQPSDEAAREAALFGAPPADAPAADAPVADAPAADEPAADAPDEEPDPEAEREAALFGEAPAEPSPADVPPTAPPPGEDREAALFGGDGAPAGPASDGQWSDAAVEARLEAKNDPLQLGGRLYLRFQTSVPQDTDFEDWRLSNPNLVDLYLDARPTRRVRAFLQTRVTHDTTVQTGDTDPITGAAAEPTDVVLDQLWLKFDVERRVFVTIGKQRVKWGAARFWNPTDFLNAERLDPLAIFDERLGVPLVELHVPLQDIGGNLYLVGLPGGADALGEVGGAARVEWLFATTEVSASVAGRDGQPLRLGGDLSTALWDLDVKLEGAVQHGGDDVLRRWEGEFDLATFTFPTLEDRSDDWIPQVAAGFEWGIPYGDDDTLYLTGEYFFNDAGYGDADLYPWFLATDASRGLEGGIPGVDLGRGRDFTPLYLGRHYAALGLLAAGPGTWNDTTFLLSGIGNLSDRSFLARFDYQVRVLTRLSIFAFVAAHLGQEGELKLALDLPPVPGVEGLEDGISVPPTVVDVGLWLSVDL